MTARGFIEQIFSRRQAGVDSNLRYITREQLELLRKLIDQDATGELRPGVSGSFVWILAGERFIVTQDPTGRRRSILWMKVQRIESGGLFD
jgi:hypothetical protein